VGAKTAVFPPEDWEDSKTTLIGSPVGRRSRGHETWKRFQIDLVLDFLDPAGDTILK
jgi:hypothetical protein